MKKTVSVIKEGREQAYYEISDLIEYLKSNNDDFVCTACLYAIDKLETISQSLLEE